MQMQGLIDLPRCRLQKCHLDLYLLRKQVLLYLLIQLLRYQQAMGLLQHHQTQDEARRCMGRLHLQKTEFGYWWFRL